MTAAAGLPVPIAPSGFFVLRTPLLPFDDLLAWSDNLAAPVTSGDEMALDRALVADRSVLRARLAAVLARPDVREAIFVASPSLEESLDRWVRDPDGDRGQRVERALVRYFSRMAGRATPFGLFAGCGIGAVGGDTHLSLAGGAESTRHTRLDMDYLFSLTAALSRDPAVRRTVRCRPNSSLDRAAGRLRYVEARVDGKVRSHHLVSVEPTEVLEATLERARDGATLECLAAALVDDDVSLEDGGRYIEELIDAQLLVSDLAIPVTGDNPIDIVIQDLRACDPASTSAGVLSEVRSVLAGFDATGPGVTPDRYRAAARALESLPAKGDLDRLFQVDLIKKAHNARLGSAILEEIMAGVEILRRIAGSRHQEPLLRFRQAFVERYEGREIPLSEALDDESGIGFGSAAETSPLLHDLAFPPATGETVPWTDRDTIMLRKLTDALARGHQEIRLEPADVDALAARDRRPLPNAFSVIAAVAAADDAALARGDFLLRLDGVDGPSGARLLGRFCYADASLRQHVEEHLRAEEAIEPDAVFAEIVHLPEGRLGNILYRPPMRSFEIPYLGRSGVPPQRQIRVSDLMVSVRGDEIILRSASLNRRIVPRLTTAHNFTRGSVGFYRFLCALQSQGVTRGLGWDWGPLANASFLPRIVTRRLVLSRARWHLEKEELRQLTRVAGRTLFEAVRRWRSERGLPRWVVLADGDNTLPIDFDSILSVESFAHLVKERDQAVLMELFPAPDQLCAGGPEGRFVHELVIPFVQTHSPNAAAGRAAATKVPHDIRAHRRASVAPVRRSFPPGSEWLFVKLYCGTAAADDVLREVIAPVVRSAIPRGASDCWFFIRYHDPSSHVRVRFHGEPDALQQTIWPAIQAAAESPLADGRIWRVVLDTYEREVERYGGPEGIVLVERLFHADSEAVLEIVELLDRGDTGLDERWRLVLYAMDRLLIDFELDVDERLAMITDARVAFAREFRCDRNLEHQLGDRFRRERATLRDLLAGERESDENPLQPGVEIVAQRSALLRPIVDELHACERSGRLTLSCREIVPSLLHMHANRLLRSAQREQELVLYDFLARHYQSQAARRISRRQLVVV